MLLSRGYSADEIKVLDDYVFIVRKKSLGESTKGDDNSILRKSKKRNSPKNLVCLTKNKI